MNHSKLSTLFCHISKITSLYTGRPASFMIAVTIIVVWGMSGPFFNWSDTWQLVINTGTTIVTFLMVFLIQNTQNRESEAVQLKLDELIRTNKRARNRLLAMEDMSEEQLDRIKKGFMALYKQTRKPRKKRAVSKRSGVVREKK